MRKLLIAAVALVAALAVLAGAASAAPAVNHVGIVDKDFSPSAVTPGGESTLVLTVSQTNPQSHGSITLTWTNPDLTYVGNGDTSASCTTGAIFGTHYVQCNYTDFAHGYKSDGFTFDVSPDAAAGETITVNDFASVGTALAHATSTLDVVAVPVAPKQVDNAFYCYSVFQHDPAVAEVGVVAGYEALGNWAPSAVKGNVAGGTNLGDYHLDCNAPGSLTGAIIDANGIGVSAAVASSNVGYYKVKA